MPELTDFQKRALHVLCEHGPLTCTGLAEFLWTENRHNTRQSYARPGGKVLRALEKHGLATERWTRRIFSGGKLVKASEWHATDAGSETDANSAT